MRLPRTFQVVRRIVGDTVDGFATQRGDLLAAALAFYALLAIAPIVLIAVAAAGLIFGSGPARAEVSRIMHDTMGNTAAKTVDGWVDQASHTSGVASGIGVLLTLMTASRLVTHLRSAINQMWNVDVKRAEGFKASVRNYLRRRLFGFALVLASGPLLLVVMASRALLSGLHSKVFTSFPLSGALAQIAQLLFSIALVWGLTAIVFRILPDLRIRGGTISIGALLTSLAFNAGTVLIGWYLGRAAVSVTYGAAGSAVAVLIWMYLSAQIFLYGAELTQILSVRFPKGVRWGFRHA